ncbi:MAG TPA: secondary thiamine-phosphate synthase enzyme YjbQ [Opitutaceae bacterium]|jgi:secondary thiamine-phosphate synthase enzyme|nr:secondary thiamine-phosphate synthase enzyme YjbQ [Opitutaceae bacterium]
MPIHHSEVTVATQGAGFYEITRLVERELRAAGLKSGVATVFCRHTSCSLTLMENASPDARRDLQRFMERLVPPGRYEHSLEGPDDMPSHIRSVLTQSSISIPFADGSLRLGTWQGLYLWEHRAADHRRSLALAFYGE